MAEQNFSAWVCDLVQAALGSFLVKARRGKISQPYSNRYLQEAHMPSLSPRTAQKERFKLFFLTPGLVSCVTH